MSYWVVGGHYKNTKFDTFRDGYEIEKYGPFNTYKLAKEDWDARSWANVDDCYVRYTVVPHK